MKLPNFKTTEDALTYGKIATSKQVKAMVKLRRLLLARSDAAMRQGNHQEALDLAVDAQFLREAIEISKEQS